VLTLDPSIDVAGLARMVASAYGPCEPLDFVPVGGDSWGFVARPLWVSVRRDRGGHWRGAYESAAWLRNEGLEFVLAPVVSGSGEVVADVSGHPVVVFRFLDGAELDPAEASSAQAAAVAEMISRLHAIDRVDIDLPRESFVLPFADELEIGVARALAGTADVGPYAASLTRLVRSNRARVADLRAEMTRVRQTCQQDEVTFVLTHGEPTNAFARLSGELLLMDWGSLGWAPPERDWLALTDLGIPWPRGTRPHLRRYYELRWILSEVAEYVSRFTTSHAGDVADDDKWSELLRYLPATG